ncbi:MAG: hypothetical protein U0401_32755 [Anaerolineae bacterium]
MNKKASPNQHRVWVKQPLDRPRRSGRCVESPRICHVFVVIVLFLVGAIVNPRFVGLENQKIVTRDTAILAIAAIGVGFPIITGGIDLSIGSIVGLGGVLSAFFIVKLGLPIWLSIVLALLGGWGIGAIHGLFVTRFNMHGVLITLGHAGGRLRLHPGADQWHPHYRP